MTDRELAIAFGDLLMASQHFSRPNFTSERTGNMTWMGYSRIKKATGVGRRTVVPKATIPSEWSEKYLNAIGKRIRAGDIRKRAMERLESADLDARNQLKLAALKAEINRKDPKKESVT